MFRILWSHSAKCAIKLGLVFCKKMDIKGRESKKNNMLIK